MKRPYTQRYRLPYIGWISTVRDPGAALEYSTNQMRKLVVSG
jgi:hypothetical protein